MIGMKEHEIIISAKEMQSHFYNLLIKHGFTETKAKQCAEVFTSNSIDGVYTHGINRFAKFIQYVKEGYIKTNAEPTLISGFAGIEQWHGNLGVGPFNAIVSTNRAIQLARKHGIGCVALSNTNHWMRGGYYGWKAAKQGLVFIGWTNTIANMPAWNAVDSKVGNNPLVFAVPYKDEAIVLDMAMSQFSYGTMEMAVIKNEKLSVNGGYDKDGNLTNDPSEILETKRPLPAGYWKGSGLALLLDILATVLSGGLSTSEISKQSAEHSVSQVFICIDVSKLNHHSSITLAVQNIINDYHQSVPVDRNKKIVYPGERILITREKNLKDGIPVLKTIWEEVLKL